MAVGGGLAEREQRAGTGDAQLPLRLGVSTRALFDLEAEHAIFEREGVEAYAKRQRGLEATGMGKGPGFDAIARLLALNRPGEPQVVEAVLLSRNAPDMSLRAFAAIMERGLPIARGSFTGGRPIAPLLRAWGVDLFLSNEAVDVEAAAATGVAAARFGIRPDLEADGGGGELRIAFDGDAVVFSEASEEIFEREGLHAFLSHETENATVPMETGPFGPILRKLGRLQEIAAHAGRDPIRTALVTARSAPAHARAIHTLRSWGVTVDEAHFAGDADKGPILEAFGAHVFFDDSERHVASASRLVASARVPRRREWRPEKSGALPTSPEVVSSPALLPAAAARADQMVADIDPNAACCDGTKTGVRRDNQPKGPSGRSPKR